MYEFVDTIEMQEGALSLPAEAVQINGQWLENAVSGYRTLNVSGREIVDVKIQDTSYVTKNGSYFIGEKIEPRILKITYQLLADSAADYRDAFNQLLGILHSGELTVIFNDEDDKYFKGYLYAMEEPNAGSNKITGSFSIYCPDPLKYSIEETVVEETPDRGDVIEVDYGGTEKAYPIIEVIANSTLGWITLFKNNKKLTLGNTDANLNTVVDVFEKDFDVNGQPVFQNGLSYDALYDRYGVAAWELDSVVQKGSFIYNNIRTYFDTSSISDSDFTTNKWCGGSYIYNLPEPITNFNLSLTSFFEGYQNPIPDTMIFQIAVHSSDAPLDGWIATITNLISEAKKDTIIKIGVVDTAGYLSMLEQNFSPYICPNRYDGAPSYTFNKFANEISLTASSIFNSPKTRTAVSRNASFEDWAIDKISISVFVAKSNGYYAFQNWPKVNPFKMQLDEIAENGGQNVILKNDDIVADCGNADIIVNGANNDGFGNLDNDWEDFALEDGLNVFQVAYHPDALHAPTVKIKYKEAYL